VGGKTGKTNFCRGQTTVWEKRFRRGASEKTKRWQRYQVKYESGGVSRGKTKKKTGRKACGKASEKKKEIYRKGELGC